jgi:hypothetical protein
MSNTETRVTDITDNIDPTPAVAESTPAPQSVELYNIAVAMRTIAAHYEREFPKLTFSTQSQIVDGCVAEFVDTAMGVTVATARIRFRNKLIVNDQSGDIFLAVELSDMSFTKPSLNLSTKK